MITKALKETYSVYSEKNVIIKIGKKTVTFDLLIQGYGSKRGMVIDASYGKLKENDLALVKLGYGWSNMNIAKMKIGDW